MNVEASQRQPFLARFRREAEILGTLRHPHIVDITDWNALPDGSPYLVMELLEGEDLAALLGRQRMLPLPQALPSRRRSARRWTRRTKPAWSIAISSPATSSCAKRGVSAVRQGARFGIAKWEQTDRTPLTANAALMGTPGYMAPEQALGKSRELDARCDQFALAAILYEMLAGQPAFYRSGDAVFNILERDPRRSGPRSTRRRPAPA